MALEAFGRDPEVEAAYLSTLTPVDDATLAKILRAPDPEGAAEEWMAALAAACAVRGAPHQGRGGARRVAALTKVRPMGTSPFGSGVVAALAAALLFGVGAPAAKWLVADADPIVLSAILYLGAGIGLTVLRFGTRDRRREAALRRDDVALVVGMTLAGGVLARSCCSAGLRRVSAVTGRCS